MIQRILLCVLGILLLFGCSSHSTFALKPLDGDNKAKAMQNGVTLSARPFLTTKELKNYFGEDLVKKGLLPLQVHILNESDSDIGVVVESMGLLPPDARSIMAADSSAAYKKAKSGFGATPIHVLAFGMVGLFGSTANVTAANMKLASDLESKLLKDGIVQRHKYVDGVVFFPIQGAPRSLNGWHLYLKIYHRKKMESFEINVPL